MPRGGGLRVVGPGGHRVFGIDLHLAVAEVEVQEQRITRALDADRHAELGIARHDGRDGLDQLGHGRRGPGGLPGGTAAHLITARKPVERVVQSASHVTVPSSAGRRLQLCPVGGRFGNLDLGDPAHTYVFCRMALSSAWSSTTSRASRTDPRKRAS